MKRTICFQCVLWICCVLSVSVSPYILAQTLPPLIPANVKTFTIPFEIGNNESVKDVELLVSKDRGKHWYAADRQSVESKKFMFKADADGEYWFVFRTISLTGAVSSTNGQPQLRVSVNTASPAIVLPPQQTDSGPLAPPKPARFRDKNEQKPAPATEVVVPKKFDDIEKDDAAITKTDAAKNDEKMPLLGPSFPGFEFPAESKKNDSDLLDDLLSGMSSFMDVQPVAVKSIPSSQIAADKSNVAVPAVSSKSAGSISGIALNNGTKPQIVVKWNVGDAPWQDAQIDILRSTAKEGQGTPIAINLPNNGEYWWYLTPDDLKPFYLTVRIRSLHGGISLDTTRAAIDIEKGIQNRSAKSGEPKNVTK